jgi:hypothetical protein
MSNKPPKHTYWPIADWLFSMSIVSTTLKLVQAREISEVVDPLFRVWVQKGDVVMIIRSLAGSIGGLLIASFIISLFMPIFVRDGAYYRQETRWRWALWGASIAAFSNVLELVGIQGGWSCLTTPAVYAGTFWLVFKLIPLRYGVFKLKNSAEFDIENDVENDEDHESL